ncbi:MAG: FAD:protein FMN transferase [Thiogranum sp.]|nr:FAD:protein FMN transferase [Thiogranum sp.]
MIGKLINLTLVFWLSSFLAACSQEEVVYRDELIAFGTLVSFTLHGVDPAQGTEVIRDVDLMFQEQHKNWHAWQKGQLTELNAAIAAGKSMQVDPSIIHLIKLGQSFERNSIGLFNPAIGDLLRLWGFQQDEAASGPPPAKEKIQAWLKTRPSTFDLEFNGQTIQSNNANVSLDFGGFAKGYSVGKAVQLIEEHNIRNFVVNAGGDLCIRGRHGDRPWRVGVRDPYVGTGILASIELEGSACVFTSGSYERYFDYGGHRYHHILDPRSGEPAAHSASVTVIAGDPTLADAAATAIFVAGPQQFRIIARRMGISDVLLIDNNGNAYLTPGLKDRLRFEQEPKSLEIVEIASPDPESENE